MGGNVLLLLATVCINYVIALWIEKYPLKKKILLLFAIIYDLALLCYFKYANFFMLNIIHVNPNSWIKIALPIGISFYIFQCLSYVIDVYHQKIHSSKNIVDFGAYLTSFPQLIAGPIVRYKEVEKDIYERNITLNDIYEGAQRFIWGFAKKMLIANQLGWVADQIYAIPMENMDTRYAWFGIIAYTLQIYYDFSGYSDMAIGLGRMFGFHFPENFYYPYTSASIREFWHRWHMTLSCWFKDYLYIPLGGNKISTLMTMRNQWIVFALCGFWHGASWNFVVWGLYHGFFLTLESGRWGNILHKLPNLMQHVYALLIINVGWVLFRSESISHALKMIKAAFGFNDALPYVLTIARFYRIDLLCIFIIAIFGSMPIIPNIQKWADQNIFLKIMGLIFLGILFVLSCSWSVSTTFNPFIYFRF